MVLVNLAQIHQRNYYLRQLQPYNIYFLSNENGNDSLIHGLQNGCGVSSHGNNADLTLHHQPHQSSWVARSIVKEQSYFERNLFYFLSSCSQ